MAGTMEKNAFGLEGFVELAFSQTPMGVYVLAWEDEIVYIGRSRNVPTRLGSHWQAYLSRKWKRPYRLTITRNDIRGIPIKFNRVFVKYLETELECERLEIELIHRFRPKLNITFNNSGQVRSLKRVKAREGLGSPNGIDLAALGLKPWPDTAPKSAPKSAPKPAPEPAPEPILRRRIA